MASRERLTAAAWVAVALSAALVPAIPQGGVWSRPYDDIAVIAGLAFALAVGTNPRDIESYRRLVIAAWPLWIFAGVVVVSALIGGIDGDAIKAVAKHLAPVVMALTAAITLATRDLRAILVATVIGIGVLQMVVAGVQVLNEGFDLAGVDQITGTFGDSASGLLTVYMTGCATLCLGLALAWRRYRVALVMLALAFPLVGVIASGRAVIFLAPAAFGTLILFDLVSRNPYLSRRLSGAALAGAILLIPVTVGALEIVYPGSTDRIRSLDGIREYLNEDDPQGGLRQGAMLTRSFERSAESSVRVLLLGKGAGATTSDTQPQSGVIGSDADPPRPARPKARQGRERRAPVGRDAQARREVTIDEFNTVWAPRLVTEAGMAGVAAWLLVLVWSVFLALRARVRAIASSVDSGVVMAVPGLAALALLASVYNTAPVTPVFEVVFWAGLGICLRLAFFPSRPEAAIPVDQPR